MSAPPAERALGHTEEALVARDAEAVLDHLEWKPSAFGLPDTSERSTPRDPGFWLARAVAFAPEVRAARNAWREVRAARVGKGAPEPAFLQMVDHSFGADDPLLEAIAVFDVLGLARLGPAAAERDTARALEAQRLAELEAAAWRAWTGVERARLRWHGERARVAGLGRLVAQAEEDLQRVEILERTGRAGRAEAEAATGAARSVTRRASLAADAAGRAAADLSVRVGVPDAGSLADATRAVAALSDTWVARAQDREALLPAVQRYRGDHPDLRALAVAFEVSDAEVRAAAAQSWPSFGIGPHLGLPEGDTLSNSNLGAAVRLRIPFPSQWKGALGAAVERREAALDAYEDAWFALDERARDACARVARAAQRIERATGPLDVATEASWTATRAAFRTGRVDVAAWRTALLARADAIDARETDAAAVELAKLDLIEAGGPVLTPFLRGGQAGTADEPRTVEASR